MAGGLRSSVSSPFVGLLSGLSLGVGVGVPEGLFVPSVSGEGDGLVGAVDGRWAPDVVREGVGPPP